jgi:hypothetical protein
LQLHIAGCIGDSFPKSGGRTPATVEVLHLATVGSVDVAFYKQNKTQIWFLVSIVFKLTAFGKFRMPGTAGPHRVKKSLHLHVIVM